MGSLREGSLGRVDGGAISWIQWQKKEKNG